MKKLVFVVALIMLAVSPVNAQMVQKNISSEELKEIYEGDD